MSWYSNTSVWAFAGGLVAAVAGKALYQNETARSYAIDAVARGILIKEEAAASLQTLKDEVEDITADAREVARLEAIEMQQEQELYERIRLQVEQEIMEEMIAEDLALGNDDCCSDLDD